MTNFLSFFFFFLISLSLIKAIEARLARSFLQISFETRFIKTFTIETGLVEKKISISCRDSCSFLIVFLQNNICHTGSFKENYWTFSQENLKNAYITCSAGDLRIPSLPIDDIGGESAGKKRPNSQLSQSRMDT